MPLSLSLCFSLIHPPTCSALFPYTTLFRSKLGAHRDPFAGSLRYHLGLVTPNSDKCRILVDGVPCVWRDGEAFMLDRKSTRLNSSHLVISYAVFCLKKKRILMIALSI